MVFNGKTMTYMYLGLVTNYSHSTIGTTRLAIGKYYFENYGERAF